MVHALETSGKRVPGEIGPHGLDWKGDDVKKRLLVAGAGLIASALLMSACTPPQGGSTGTNSGDGNGGESGQEFTATWNQAFYSMNNNSSNGNNVTNANVMYMIDDQFKYYDKNLDLQSNEGFGTVEKVSDDPLKVKYTYADTAMWSDGTPVDAADLVLAWGAISGLFNTEKAADATNEDGTPKELTGDNVYFDSGDPGVALMDTYPEISDDGKSITFTYSKQFADWDVNLALTDSGLPAHIVAKKALGIDDPTQGKEAILKAFKDKDNATLSKIANTWNTGFDFTSLPDDKDLLVTSGPYKLTEFVEGQYLTLEKRDDYKGTRTPKISKLTIRFIEDPMASVQALQNGEVGLINPQSTADVLKAAQAVDGADVLTGDNATYEHVDLTFNNGGPFDPKAYGGDAEKAKKVRQAFLKTIPRDKIVNDMIKPLNDSAAVRNSFTTVPGSQAYDNMVKANGMEDQYAQQDIEGAKKLLDEVGVKPTVRVLYAKGNTRREQEFQLIKEAAEQAGFSVNDQGDAKWSERLGGGDYDASLFGWQSTSTAVTETAATFQDGGLNNLNGYNNEEVNKLYDQLQSETDPAKQQEILTNVEKQLVNDAYGITIFQFPDVVAAKGLDGIDPITLSPTMFWNFNQWSVKQ